MMKLHGIKCEKYSKFKQLRISFIWNETLVSLLLVQSVVVKSIICFKKKNPFKN